MRFQMQHFDMRSLLYYACSGKRAGN